MLQVVFAILAMCAAFAEHTVFPHPAGGTAPCAFFQRMIRQADDRRHGLPGDEDMLRRHRQPQTLLCIQQLQNFRLERQGQVSVARTEPPGKVDLRQLFPKAFLRPVADLFDAGACQGIHGEGACHIGDAHTVDELAGIEEEVDLNVFNGTMEELLELTLKTPCIER